MTILHALIIAALQGVTELFPISSLGHAVILPALFHWRINEQATEFLPFLVVLHLGTATALIAYFWRDWLELARAICAIGMPSTVAAGRRLFGLLVVATLPAVILGFMFEKGLRHLFGSPETAAAFLVLNGVLLFIGQRLPKLSTRQDINTLSWRGALAIGLWQCTALVPGISRSGATMLGGLLVGLDHKAAARFSFLIATPIILAAGVLEVPTVLRSTAALSGIIWTAGLVAGLTAFASVVFLMRYFRKHEVEALDPFAYYCAAAGIASFAWLIL